MLRQYREVLRGFRRHTFTSIALLAAAGLAEGLGVGALVPLLNGVLGERGGGDAWFGLRGDDLIALAIGALIVLGLIAAVLRYFADVASLRLQTDVERTLRSRMTEALLAMRWTAYLPLSLGDTAKSVLIEATQVSVGAYNLVQGIGYCMTAAAFIAIALAISPILTGATLAFGAITLVLYRWAGRRAQARSHELSGRSSLLMGVTTDVLTNAKYYRSTGNRDLATDRAAEEFRAWARIVMFVKKYQPATRLGFDSAGLVFIAAALALMLLIRGDPPAGPLAFLALFYRLAPKLQQAQQGLMEARSQSAWLGTWRARYQEAVDAADEPTGGATFKHLPTVAFDGVSLTFPERTIPALHDVSFEVARGTCLGVVGESGAGKTTVLDLVTGLLRPTSGAVRVDGVDLAEVDLEAWRSRIGLVLQDSPTFHGTILDNVAWGDKEPDRARVDHAVQLAYLNDVVGALPDGLDTHIGDRGGRLSGGQRQRLALARALYREPWLLILDEATSALDSESEAAILRALRELKGSCSMMVVAHRVSTVELADEIVVLAGGKVVEQGPWDALQQQDGSFRRLLEAQRAGGTRRVASPS